MGTELDFSFNHDAAGRRELKNWGTGSGSETPGTDTETVQAMIDTSIASIPQTDYEEHDSTSKAFLQNKPTDHLKYTSSNLPTPTPELYAAQEQYMYTGDTNSSYTMGTIYRCDIQNLTASDITGSPAAQNLYVQMLGAYVKTVDTVAREGVTYYKFYWNRRSLAIGAAAEKGIAQNIEPGNENLATSDLVYRAVSTAVSSVYKPHGDITCAELVSSLLIAANVGNVYTVTDSGLTTALFVQGTGQTITAGQSVGIIQVGQDAYKFNLMGDLIDLHDFLKKSDAETSIIESNKTSLYPPTTAAVYNAIQNVTGDIQADWNEKNELSNNYIQNKPAVVEPVSVMPAVDNAYRNRFVQYLGAATSSSKPGDIWKISVQTATASNPKSSGLWEYDNSTDVYSKTNDTSSVSGKTYYRLYWVRTSRVFGSVVEKDVASGIEEDDEMIPTSGQVFAAIAAAQVSAYIPMGNISPAAVTASKLVAANVGHMWTLTGDITTDANWVQGAGLTVISGTNIAVVGDATEGYKWNAMGSLIDVSSLLAKNDVVSTLTDDVSMGGNKPVTSAAVYSAVQPLIPTNAVTNGNTQPVTSDAVYDALTPLQNQVNNLSTSRSITGVLPAMTSTTKYRLKITGVPTWGGFHMPICVQGEGFKEFIFKSSQSWAYPGVYTWDELNTTSAESSSGTHVFGYVYHDASSGYTHNEKLECYVGNGCWYVVNKTSENENFALFGQVTGYTLEKSVNGAGWVTA